MFYFLWNFSVCFSSIFVYLSLSVTFLDCARLFKVDRLDPPSPMVSTYHRTATSCHVSIVSVALWCGILVLFHNEKHQVMS